jgi:hypothetical protein
MNPVKKSKKRRNGSDPAESGQHRFHQHGEHDLNPPGGPDNLTKSDLNDEIQMLRKITRRVMDMGDQLDSIEQAVNVLKAVGMACSKVALLLKARKDLEGRSDPVKEALDRAIQKFWEDMESKNETEEFQPPRSLE